MSAFRKAKPEQAALKIGFYGLAGAGKTFTALLCAEGLARVTGKRIAFIDTERGTDFYAQAVQDRQLHPGAFDFDALYSRSIVEVSNEVRALDPNVHGVIVIDSITHIWEAAKAAYAGKLTRVGTLPFHAWAGIKKPYKELIAWLLSTPMHVILCGRQGNVFEEDEETGEMKKVGEKMKAEGETPYEPNILIHLEAVRRPGKDAVITAFAEKDRTGVLAGKTFANPNFDNLIKPILPLLGAVQAQIPTEEEVGGRDAEALSESEKSRVESSEALLCKLKSRINLCETQAELKTLGKGITPEFKKQLVTSDLAQLREAYLEAEKRLNGK